MGQLINSRPWIYLINLKTFKTGNQKY